MVRKWTSAAIAAAGLVLAGSSAMAQPKLIDGVAPEYPRAAERRGISGEVRLQFDVLDDGKTANVTVIEANPAGVFDRSAMTAVSRWRFEKGQPATGMTKRVVFQPGA